MRRLGRIFLRTLLVLVVALAVAYWFRVELFGDWVREKIAQTLADSVGGTWRIHAIEGSWTGDFAVVGMELVTPPPAGPLAAFSCARAHASYSILALLGDEPVSGIKRVDVSGANVVLDLTRPPAPPSSSESGDIGDVWEQIPASLPAVYIKGSVVVRRGGAETRVGALTLNVNDKTLTLEAREIAEPELPQVRGLTMRVVREQERAFTVALQEAIAGVRIERARARFEKNGAFTAQARLTVAGGTIDVETNGTTVQAVAKNIDLSKLEGLPEPLAGLVDAQVSMDEAFRVQGTVKARDVRARDWTIERIDLEALWAKDKLTLARLEAIAGDDRVIAKGVAVEQERPYLVAAVDEIDIFVRDAQRFAPQLPAPVRVEVHASSPDGRSITIRQAEVASGPSNVKLVGSATLPADPAAWRKTIVALELNGTVVGLRQWHETAPLVEGPLRCTGSLEGILEAARAQLEVSGQDLRIEGRVVQELFLRGDLVWPQVRDLHARLVSDAGKITLQGRADLDAQTLQDGKYDINVTDLSELAAMIPGAPSLRGTLTGNGALAWDGARLEGSAELAATGLFVDSTKIGALNALAVGEGAVFSVRELRAEGPWGQAQAKFAFDIERRTATITSAQAITQGETFALRGEAQAKWDQEGVHVSGLDVSGYGGQFVGSGAWLGNGPGLKPLRADGRVENVALERLDARFRGALGASVSIRGTTAKATINVPELRFEDYVGTLAVDVRHDESGIVLRELNTKIGDILTVQGVAELPWYWDAKRWQRVAGREPRLDITGSLRDAKKLMPASMSTVSVDAISFVMKGDAASVRADLDVTNFAPHPDIACVGVSKIALRVGTDGMLATVKTAPSAAGTLEGEIRSPRRVDWMDPDSWRAALESAQIDGRGAMDVPDLGILKRFTREIRHCAGRGHVSLQVSGALREPDFDGGVTLDGIELKMAGELPPFEKGRLEATYKDRKVTIDVLRGELGHAPIAVRGTVDLAAGRLGGGSLPDFDLSLQGENALLVRNRHLRLRSNVDLKLKTSGKELKATGIVKITDALYSEPMDLFVKGAPGVDLKLQLFSIRTEPFRSMKLDVKVEAERSFRIRNNVVRGDFSLDLTLGGTGEVPEPRGAIFLRDTLVKLPFSSLKVDQGEIRFRPEDPFAPVVNVAARTRMKGYELNVQTKGALPDVQVFISSKPTLSQEDAILLLTTGATRAELEGQGIGRAALTKVGMFFGKRLVSSVSGPSDPDERTLLDRFSFEIGRDISRSGQETIEGEFELTPRYYLRGERDRYDEYNIGIVWRIRFR